MYTFICRKAARLDLLLREQLPEKIEKADSVSNSKIRRLIIAGAVQVNGSQCRIPSYSVRAGSTVKATVDSERFFYEKDAGDIQFEMTDKDVLYEDDVIIVANKPAFFPSEAGMVDSRDNMHDAVVRYLHKRQPELRNPPYAGIMHRLDRETSGVILFTKQRSVNAAVHDMFEQHTARKIYRAVTVCPPVLPEKEFSADTFTGRISPKSSAAKWGSVPECRGGLHAHTDFTFVNRGICAEMPVLYIEARPLTGRTHQIRVHLSSLGMPILGDELYGAPEYSRIMLHAFSLTFPHPITGSMITVSAPLPEGF